MKHRTFRAKTEELTHLERRFTVFFEPVFEVPQATGSRRQGRRPKQTGYQVTVPLLPGLITFGRTLAEARSMARDAIRCHLEGLRKAGEPIPEERHVHSEKLRIALSA